jgi:hypothetical protein
MAHCLRLLQPDALPLRGSVDMSKNCRRSFDEAQIAELQCVFVARWQLGLMSSKRTAAGTPEVWAKQSSGMRPD